jgi:DsbC/DsbD-like thiol-disulfide interchange protein/cytochrome c biogenesis protein CcdA
MRATPLPFLTGILVFLALLFAAPLWAQGAAPAARPDNMARGPAMLIAEKPVMPGGQVDLALRFLPDPGWHGYWSNPGDAGQGMTLDWRLPAGWRAEEPLYPVPQMLVISGLMNHVYEGEHAVLVPLRVPADAVAGRSYPVEVFAQWLSCSDTLCVPQWATLRTSVTVGGGTAADDRFDGWRAALAPLLDRPASFELTPRFLRLAIPLPATLELAEPHVFIGQTGLVDYPAAQTFRRAGDMLVVEIPRKGTGDNPGQVDGIIKLDTAGGGVRFIAGQGAVPSGGELVAGPEAAELAPLWLLLGGALLGGLVLNLMPCVFPILSLKALSLARAGESEAGARREGIAYTAGVMLACLALGGLLLALRAGGSEIGWAFQLQEPGVVVALLVLAVLITANFAGLYEVPSLSFTRRGGRGSAFSTGLLAAFVATPCTGPFMAAALGAALLLPWWQGLLLFGALGLGLALPFLLLGFVPALRKLLPKPGQWMDTFRRVLAVPMGLTALALAWLAWRLGGPWFVALSLALAVGLIVLLVAWQRGLRPVAAGSLAAAVLAAVALPQAYAVPAASDDSLLAPVAYSDSALASAQAQGKPVFLWFTADWCLTCKVNESVAIEREETRAAFEKAGVVAMRGDWTRRDPAITRFLTQQGAAGVPLYLWYQPGQAALQLPQVLTPDMLAELAGS